MKNNNGVSMIELVIVIIILLIIATFSIFSSSEVVDQATATEIYTEIESMRKAINNINVKKELNEDFILTSGEHYDVKVSDLNEEEIDFELEYDINIEPGKYDKLYVIYGMDEIEKYNESKVRENYGLDSIKHTYLVNFDDGEVELLRDVTIAEKNVRTYEQIRALVDDGEI